MRLCGEFHGTEQAVQTPVILIFQPGCACVFVAGDGHDVFAVVQRFGDIEFVRGVAVFAVADEYAVDPHVDRGGHAVERDADGAAIFQRRGDRTVKREGTAVERSAPADPHGHPMDTAHSHICSSNSRPSAGVRAR